MEDMWEEIARLDRNGLECIDLLNTAREAIYVN
jgi:hypothetical protein